MVLQENIETRDRRSRILDGARAAFLRFGFECTSLADIAAGAGASRTALYHYFTGKEDVLQAVVEELHATNLRQATAVLERGATLQAALVGLLEVKFGRLLATISTSPHAAELVDATHCLTGAATRTADDTFQKLVVSALVRHGRGNDAEDAADTLIAAVKRLMRSGKARVTKHRLDARVRRLLIWFTAY